MKKVVAGPGSAVYQPPQEDNPFVRALITIYYDEQKPVIRIMKEFQDFGEALTWRADMVALLQDFSVEVGIEVEEHP